MMEYQNKLSDAISRKLIKYFTPEERNRISQGFELVYDSEYWHETIEQKKLNTTCLAGAATLPLAGNQSSNIYFWDEYDEYIVPLSFDTLTEAQSFVDHVTSRF